MSKKAFTTAELRARVVATYNRFKKGKKNVQEEQQSQVAALPRHQEGEETDKTKQAQIKQTYENTKISSLFP